MRLFPRIITAAAVSGLALANCAAGAQAGGTIAVRVTDGRLTLRADNALLEHVVATVQRESGVPVHRASPLAGRITVSFRDVPLEAGLRRLLAGTDLVMLYARADSPVAGLAAVRLTDVRVYASAFRGPRSVEDDIAAVTAREDSGLDIAAVDDARDDAVALRRLLRTADDRHTRMRAADALGHLGDADAIAALAGALRDDDASVRERAVNALGRTWNEQAVEPLALALLEDGDAFVREAAALALGATWSDAAVGALGQALTMAPERGVREAAARALSVIGAPDAVPFLIRALDDPRGSVRESAAEALGAIGTPDTVPPLNRAALEDEDPWVSARAAEALQALSAAR